jgi:hypothetical protein
VGVKKTVEEIIRTLWLGIEQPTYSIEELKRLVEHAYEEGRGDGYNEGYKDADEIAQYDKQEYLK